MSEDRQVPSGRLLRRLTAIASRALALAGNRAFMAEHDDETWKAKAEEMLVTPQQFKDEWVDAWIEEIIEEANPAEQS